MTDTPIPPRLGATVLGAATRFEVWAPSAGAVEVGLLAADAAPDAAPTATHTLVAVDAHPGTVTWQGTVAGVGHGDRYRLRLDGGDWLADPASRWQPDGVHGPSAVVDPARFEWHDDGWQGVALADTVLYELHVGSFTPTGTFDGVIGELDRLVDLGVTTIELMPVNAFPGARNWGYDGVFPSAVQATYGGPEGLARLVDAAHGRGLGVVVDVVYNHLGPEGNVLGRFGDYFTDAYRTPWGDAVNVAGAGSDSVRRYFIESAVGWVRDFHVDGLRLDAVHAIVDPTPLSFVSELTSAVHAEGERQGRTVLVTIESSANDPRIIREVAHHGWGCDAVWNDDVHHAVRVALTGEQHEYYAAYRGIADIAAAWTGRWVYSGQHSPTFGRRHGAPVDDVDPAHFIVFTTNHDHVGNTPAGARMLADAPFDDPRHRLAAAAILLSPFTPMLFMGEEYGEPAPFPYFVDHGDPELVEAVRQGRRREFASIAGEVADPADPDTFRRAVLDAALARNDPYRARLALYRRLLELRRQLPTLTDPGVNQEVALDGAVLRIERAADDTTLALTFNFSATAASAGDGEVVFDSDENRWGGPGADRDTIGPWSARLQLR